MKEQPNYYAIIPAKVRYDKELSANAKLLYAEITALSGKEGYCWANNGYFAELYGCTERTITRNITQLVDKGYLKREEIRDPKTQRIVTRKLYISDGFFEEPTDTQCQEGQTKLSGGADKIVGRVPTKMSSGQNADNPSEIKGHSDLEPIDKNVGDNNTSINNTSSINTRNNNKGVPTPRDTPFESKIIDFTKNTELQQALRDFIESRKQAKAPFTQKAFDMMLKELRKLGQTETEQLKIVTTSVINGWRGIFPLDKKTDDDFYTRLQNWAAQGD